MTEPQNFFNNFNDPSKTLDALNSELNKLKEAQAVSSSPVQEPIMDNDFSIQPAVLESKSSYVKRKFGSGTKSWTPNKRYQCPVCKYYFTKLNESHLKAVHKMTVEDLLATDAEKAKFFLNPYYAMENSDYALANPNVNDSSSVLIYGDATDPLFFGLEKSCSEVIDVFKESFKDDLNFDEENYRPFQATEEENQKAQKYANFLENIKDTPKRMAKAYEEMLSGMIDTDEQMQEILSGALFPSDYSGAITECNIKTIGLCPHHMLPIQYTIHISYMPNKKKIGLSKLPRCAEVLSKRLVLQEDLTEDIANFLMKYLEAKGVAIIVKGIHGCMLYRGVKQDTCTTTTTVVKGVYAHNLDLKNEFMQTAHLSDK
jgi:GTP cyclohydrolase IA